MEIVYKNQRIKIPVRKVSEFGKAMGLMFKKKTTDNLVFEFDKNINIRIHSYFVFFDFLAIWINNKNKVIEWEIVKPFILSIKPRKSFIKLIEVPLNKKNKKILEFFVDKGKI
jgi:uncharacterized membrane protein (UPF0127 family)|tara:strand:+ start:13272 stop:13610 length:339 start_codon:yes stop_codon:yes gene_type:complete